MSSSIGERPPSAPSGAPGASLSEAQWAIRFLCTSNPFYVVSAGLFLAGLWLSCDPEKAAETWALMAGLIGYTLLLAGTAFLLIRFAKVWDDARTVLLLVVLMFLATSVTFDRTIVFAARFVEFRHIVPGWAWNIVGLVTAVVISEAILHGVRLKLPSCYRVPYYLFLALFFLYPVALAPLVSARPHNEPMMWGLFLFPSVAALLFLTLLPAVWRGADAMKNNGSPWPWPLYPWTLFGLFALAVPARAVLLCYSMHLIDVRDLYEMTLGFYFLTPLGLSLAVLLLEAGLKSKRDLATWIALSVPIVLIALSTLGHREEKAYTDFLDVFKHRLGVGPVWFTLLLSALLYAYAALRGVRVGLEALVGVLGVTMIVQPDAVDLQWHVFNRPHATVLIALSTVLLGLGIWRRVSWRCLVGALGLVAGLTLAFPLDAEVTVYRWPIAYHLALLAALIVSVAFEDELAQTLRFVAPFVAMIVCLALMFLPIRLPDAFPTWALAVYPPAIAIMLGAFGLIRWNLSTLAMAGFLLGIWGLTVGWQAYRVGRQIVVGLDYLVLSAAVFGIAFAISLGKSGLLGRWLEWWRDRATPEED